MIVSTNNWDKIFTNDFIYLTFYSYNGISVEINVLFTEEDSEAEWRKQKKMEDQ
jgi:hypothetical protein